jgi:hypothetical protein
MGNDSNDQVIVEIVVNIILEVFNLQNTLLLFTLCPRQKYKKKILGFPNSPGNLFPENVATNSSILKSRQSDVMNL